MPKDCSEPRAARFYRLPRPADQAAVALLLLLALGATVAWFVRRGGLEGRLVEVERAGPRRAAFTVDLNSAEWVELAQLPAIGEVLARRIVEERQTRGPYRSQRDILRVRGIGPLTFQRILPYLQPIEGPEAVAAR